jgi:hypothetical protein
MQFLSFIGSHSHALLSLIDKLNTKKTKKCSHGDDAEMILLILGNFHERGLIEKARRKISGILVLPNDTDLDKYLTNYNIIKHN